MKFPRIKFPAAKTDRNFVRKIARNLALAVFAPLFALYLLLRFTPYSGLKLFLEQPASSRIYDRNGVLLQITPVEDGIRREYVPLNELRPGAAAVFIAAEDKRFYYHFGVDIVSIIRAAFQNVSAGRRVSGASTITMQLARIIAVKSGVNYAHPFVRKAAEAFNALRLETRLTKNEILELYLNSTPFSFQTEGIASAARNFFAAEAAALNPAQTFCLAVIPRRPSAYNPILKPAECRSAAEALQQRFSKTLSNQKKYPALVSITDDDWDSTLKRARRFEYPFEAPHLVRRVLTDEAVPKLQFLGRQAKLVQQLMKPQFCRHHDAPIGRKTARACYKITGFGTGSDNTRLNYFSNSPGSSNSSSKKYADITLTVDIHLQHYIEGLIAANIERYHAARLNQGAAIVIDNADGAVLAWVGSAGFDSENGGQIDGALALNQPGSSMKPFLYALALERGFKPNTTLADIPVSFGGGEVYIPQNFNNRFNGPVLLRQALASSLNIPAVELLYRLSVKDYSDFLAALGFDSLSGEAAANAGLGLALGNAPVSLVELARAFSVFPNDGNLTRLHYTRRESASAKADAGKERVLSQDTARIICSFLSDKDARYLAFGQARNFNADFPLIVKTGTANQYQSIVALAASRRFTGAVWMGNFSGETVMGKTGSSIPAAIVRDSLVFLHTNFEETGGLNFDEPESFVKIPVCAVSGLAPAEACSSVLYEYAREPPGICTWHRMENGTPVTSYPAEYQSWLLASRREGAAEHSGGELLIVTPRDNFVFFAAGDPNQAVPVEVSGGAFDELRVFYDGEERVVRRPFKFFLPLEKGTHTLSARCGDEIRRVRFTVE